MKPPKKGSFNRGILNEGGGHTHKRKKREGEGARCERNLLESLEKNPAESGEL